MIQGEIVGAAQAQVDLEKISAAMYGRVRDAITRLTISMMGRVKQKLSGEVLNVRTGRLRRSVNHKIVEENGVVSGLVGTNVVYARPHELGCQMDVQMKSFMRKQTMAFGKMMEPKEVLVRAHTRKMNLPPRSFLASSLREMEPQVPIAIAKALEVK